MHLIIPFCVFIWAIMLMYPQIYAYIGAFWFAFGPILYQVKPTA